MAQQHSFQMIAEMKEFATFTPAEQRYIRRSLEVARDGASAAERWARSTDEAASIQAQAKLYRTLVQAIRVAIPDDIGLDSAAELIGPLITVTAFDLGEGKLTRFAAYRYLYERLFGGGVRPWLASAYVAAAALPYLHPQLRKTLLGAITAGEAASLGWSSRDPAFTPEWVEKVPVVVS
jgi:hypothetical protein